MVCTLFSHYSLWMHQWYCVHHPDNTSRPCTMELFLFTAPECDSRVLWCPSGLSKHIKTHCLPAGPPLAQSGLVNRKKYNENSYTHQHSSFWWTVLEIHYQFMTTSLNGKIASNVLEFKFLSYSGWGIGTFKRTKIKLQIFTDCLGLPVLFLMPLRSISGRRVCVPVVSKTWFITQSRTHHIR